MFDEYFEAFLADTPKSREEHYRIRYKVYCEEMGYENKNNFSDGKEYDHWDDHSAHFIVKHKNSGEWVGALRLIFQRNQTLPIQQHVILNGNMKNTMSDCSVELSRLCVVKEMRRGCRATHAVDGSKTEGLGANETGTMKMDTLRNQHFISRQIIWGLLHAASVYCYDHNITGWYFLTTNGIAKLLRKGGLSLTNVGGACFHRGIRYPFKMDVAETYHNQVWKNGYTNKYFRFSSLDKLLRPASSSDSFPSSNHSWNAVKGVFPGTLSGYPSLLL